MLTTVLWALSGSNLPWRPCTYGVHGTDSSHVEERDGGINEQKPKKEDLIAEFFYKDSY